MKVVIEIDEEKYRQIKTMPDVFASEVCQAIANGTPLPRHHGDLIDRDELQPKLHGTKSIIAGLEAPTVIPADRENRKMSEPVRAEKDRCIDNPKFDGYISQIEVYGKLYKLRCEVVEVYPMQCPKCGGKVELRYGTGECQSCGTGFTTQFKIVEE